MSPAGLAAVGQRRAWMLVALLAATATASYIARVNVSVAGAEIRRELGLTPVQVGQIFSAFLLGYALAQVPAGMLADRFGARRVLGVAAALWVAATVMLAGARTFPVLLAGRLLLGIAEAPAFPAAARAIALWIEERSRARANGFVVGAIGLGSAIAPPLVAGVMAPWGWRAALLVSAVPAAMVALAWIVVREPAPIAGAAAGSQADESVSSSTGTMTSPGFLLLTLSYTLQGYVGYIFVYWFYLYLVDVRHFSMMRGAVITSLPWAGAIVSIPLGGLIADLLAAGPLGRARGMRIVPLIGMCGSGIALAAGAHTANPWTAVVALGLATALVLSAEGPYWAAMTALAGRRRTGAAGGVMNMGCNLGGMVSPTLTPLLAGIIGWEYSLHVASLVAVLAGLLWFGIRVPEERM